MSPRNIRVPGDVREVLVVVHHPELETLSDQTARHLLKSISRVVRAAQFAELRKTLRDSGLSPEEQQSLWDRCLKRADRYPSYYIERFERGSLELTLLVSAAALYVLKITIGEDIKAVWPKARTSKAIRRILSKSLWSKSVADRLAGAVRSAGIDGRFEVTEVRQQVSVEHEVHVYLETPRDIPMVRIIRRLDVYTVYQEFRKLRGGAQADTGNTAPGLE